jgi:NTP pyrophosphatase (non-canonical NTP hydrolase)
VTTSSIQELTARVRAFADERDWQQFHTPKNLAMALSGEVGELVAEFQWLTADQSAAVMADPDLGPRVRAEIGDVTIYLVRLADVLGIDLVAAALDKLADSARRYPVDQARGSAVKARAAAETAAKAAAEARTEEAAD